MNDYIFKSNNRDGYGKTAYNHVKKKGGEKCVENSRNGLKHYLLR